MIRKLRWKVVGLNMLLLTAVLLAVFAGVFFSTRASLQHNTMEQLQQAVSGDPRALRPGEGVQPCFVAEVLPGGTVCVSSSDYYQLYDQQALVEIVRDCLQRDEDYGVLPGYHLRYLRSGDLLRVRIAFTDSTLEQSTLRSLSLSLLLLMLLSLLVLFACSYLLAGLITRPVARAWQDQQRFLSDASHELKTPLTVILSSADLLKQEQNSRYVDNIQAEGQRMKSLVEDMLTLSRAEGQGQQYAMEVLDFSDLATDAALRFEPVAFERGRTLRYDIAPHLSVQGSDEQLRQLISVLLDNAIKYAFPGSSIDMKLRQDGRHALLTVENPCDPIPPERLEHLFDRFYRLDESRGTEGFGLGLPIAQAIVHRHGGTIRCESDSRSTRFFVTLPLSS